MALYKRPNSKFWWFKFTFDGALVQKSTQVSSKKDAATIEAAFRTQLALGKIGIEPKREVPTFENAADSWMEWLKIKQKGTMTFRKYFYAVQVLKSYFKASKVDRIESKDVEKFMLWRGGETSRKTGEAITRQTVNFELLTLKMIFNRLVESKILRENSAHPVKSLPDNDRDFHVITDEEENIYLPACSPLLRDVATVMLETGMRCGEVYRVRRQDVNLKGGYLKVMKGKTPAAIRRVHLSEKARDVLRDRMKKFTGENLFPGNDIDGGAPTPTLAQTHLETITALKFKFRLYDCRHTFATRAIESGTDLLVLSSILGHSSLKMVSRYAHPSEALKAEAVKRIEKERQKQSKGENAE